MFRRFHLASRPFSSAHSWDAGPGPKGDCSRGRDRVGGYDRAGEFLALGILQDFDPEQERLRILTPLPDPARIAAVAFGSLRLEPTGKDSVSPPGARPFARVRKDTKVATSPSRRGRRRGRSAVMKDISTVRLRLRPKFYPASCSQVPDPAVPTFPSDRRFPVRSALALIPRDHSSVVVG